MTLFLVYFGLPLMAFVVAMSVFVVLQHNADFSGPYVFDLVTFDASRMADREYTSSFLNDYFGKLEKYLGKAEKSIFVLDYLAHHRSLSTAGNKELLRHYRSYFALIERQVVKNKLRYRRTLQLPLDRRGFKRSDIVAECVSLMYAETLRHIHRMFDADVDFRLYSLGSAIRPYSYIIIDDRFLISEYDRYNSRGLSSPDHLIVNCAVGPDGIVNEQVERLISLHEAWLARILKEREPVGKEEIRSVADRLEERELREVELRLSMDESVLKEILAENKVTGRMIRDLRTFTPDEVRRSGRGRELKLRIIKGKPDKKHVG